MIHKSILKTLREVKYNQFQKKSFSQSGEDLIVKFIFEMMGIKKPSYIDIGAHHPYYLNNTALFYMAGARGINIEPDPDLFIEFIKNRKDDINLNFGISDSQGELEFYLLNVPTLNTFSKIEALKYEQEGYFIKEKKKIKVSTLEVVLFEFNNSEFPDFITIDAEGVDEIIVKSIDYDKNFPKVICIETLSFSNSENGIKNHQIIEFLESKNYMLYADTYINSIFVSKKYWGKK